MGEYTGVVTDVVLRLLPGIELERSSLDWIRFQCWKPESGWGSDHGWRWRQVHGRHCRSRAEGENEEKVLEPEFGHELSSTGRRGFMFRGIGTFDLEAEPVLEELGNHLYRLRCEGSVKNYGGEVDVWIDWIGRIVVEGSVCHRYEYGNAWTKTFWSQGRRSSWTLEGEDDHPPTVEEGDDHE